MYFFLKGKPSFLSLLSKRTKSEYPKCLRRLSSRCLMTLDALDWTWWFLMVLDDVWWQMALDGTWKFEIFFLGEMQWSNILFLFLISTVALHSMSIPSPKLNPQLLTNPWDILSGRANNPPPKKKSKLKFTMKLCSTMSLLLDWLILLLIMISQT